MKESKNNIKKIIKANVAHAINTKLKKPVLKSKTFTVVPTKPIVSEPPKIPKPNKPILYNSPPNVKSIIKSSIKSKPPIINELEFKKMSEEYREIQSTGRTKRQRSFDAGVPDYRKSVESVSAPKQDEAIIFKDYGKYVPQSNVDFDVVICICSYERFNKVRRILKQLYTQETKYSFKVVLMDDGSSDERYLSLEKEFPELEYYKQVVNGGKVNYWQTVNTLWGYGSKYSCHGFLQIDDDFILCDSFLNRLMDEFFRIKLTDNSIMIFSYHVYSYEKDKPPADWWYDGKSIAIDGGTLFDNRFLKFFNHYVDIGERIIKEYTSTFFWDTIVHKHIKNYGVRVYRIPNSLAWHDGNFDSKLNAVARATKKSYTKNFIDGDNKYDYDTDLSYLTF